MQFRVYPTTDDQTRSDRNDFYRQAVLETDTKLFNYQGEEERLERINHLKNALHDAFSVLWGVDVVVECEPDSLRFYLLASIALFRDPLVMILFNTEITKKRFTAFSDYMECVLDDLDDDELLDERSFVHEPFIDKFLSMLKEIEDLTKCSSRFLVDDSLSVKTKKYYQSISNLKSYHLSTDKKETQ